MYTDKALEHGDVDEFEMVAGCVGKEAAAAVMRYFKENYRKFVTAKEIFAKYDEVKERFLAQRDDEIHATLSDMNTTLTANESKTGKRVDDMFKATAKVINDLTKNDYKVAVVHKMTSKQRQRLLQADPSLGKLIADIVRDAGNKAAA
jgi:hypothetical protein